METDEAEREMSKGIRTGAQIQLFKAIVHFTIPYFQKRWALDSYKWAFNSNCIDCWLNSFVRLQFPHLKNKNNTVFLSHWAVVMIKDNNACKPLAQC